MRVLSLLCLLPLLAAGQGYWQQEVNYKMQIDFDSDNHQFKGVQEITYVNHSPDTIKQVFYHLYFNAFQPGSMMDQRSASLADPDKRIADRIGKLKPDEQGYHRVGRLAQDNREISFDIHQTVLQASLHTPILPGDSTRLEMHFSSQVPEQIRRSGRNNSEGIDYTMTQWYPKMAAYDKDGWHPDFYVSREFYGDFGRFDLEIEIDADYVLAGTGRLINDSLIWREGPRQEDFQEMKLLPSENKRRRWHFVAEMVHDFAWAADPDYRYLRDRISEDLTLNYYFLPKYKKTWNQLPPATREFFRLMSQYYGQYPYPQFSVIQGGDGGMEYPMCTMLKGTGKLKGLIGVMGHESAHSWYYGVLASNENRYPWMDEGFTSFAESEVLHSMQGDSLPNAHLRAYGNYLFMVQQGEQEPLSTTADIFTKNRTYGISSYSKGALFLNQLRYIVGERDFNRGMQVYFDTWKFKHPDPWDFIRVMEKVSGLQLDWYLEFWVYTTKTIDYSIKGVYAQGRASTTIELRKEEEMPMPLEVKIDFREGGSRTYFIPVAAMFGTKKSQWVTPALAWPWTQEVYKLHVNVPYEDIEGVQIDPYGFMADVNPANNKWSADQSDSKHSEP